jgi:hypothetical protein
MYFKKVLKINDNYLQRITTKLLKMRILNSEEDILRQSTELTYIIRESNANTNELHDVIEDLLKASTVGRDCFFKANDLAWKALENRSFFEVPRSKAEVISYMETN